MELVSDRGPPRLGFDSDSDDAEERKYVSLGRLGEWIRADEGWDEETNAFVAKLRVLMKEAGPVVHKVHVTLQARALSPENDDDNGSVWKRRRGSR